MAVSQTVLGIVWAETSRLQPADGAFNTKARLQAVVGALAAHAEGEGSTANFAAPARLPPVGSPGGDQAAQMKAVLEAAVDSNQQGGLPLPKRAVLWETTATGEPRESERPLPAAAAWVKDGTATRTSRFTVEGDASGRVFTLYESDAEPRVGEISFVSGFTGSGVPVVRRHRHPLTLPWVLGIAAAVLFFWMLTSLVWTGRSMTQAHDLMAGTLPASSAIYLQKLDDGCKANGSAICQSAFQPGAKPPETDKAGAGTAACVKAPAPNTVSPLHSSAFCQFAWSLAVAAANSGELTEIPGSFAGYVSAIFGWPAHVSNRTGALSLAFPISGLILSVALLCIALGLGTKGRVFGIWIGPQNRISLARMQVTLWTMVVIGAFAAIALFNSGMLAESIRNAQASGAQALLDTLITFPSMPSMILAALGIAVASPMVSALIKGDAGTKAGDITVDLADDSQAKDKSGIGRFVDRLKGDGTALEVRATPADASLADLFLGETENDKNLVDVSRLQNVLITLSLVFGYGTLLVAMVRDISPETIVAALNDGKSLFPSLPPPGGIFTTLLAASHGTYLVAKAAAK
jgi:hypothetical protein